MRKIYGVIMILAVLFLSGCASSKEKIEEVTLNQECVYEDTAFTIDRVELHPQIFRMYLSGMNGTEFREYLFILKTEDTEKWIPSDAHFDTESTAMMTFRVEDEISMEQILALCIRPVGSRDDYTEFPLAL